MSKPQVYLSFPVNMPNRELEADKLIKKIGDNASVKIWTQGMLYNSDVVRCCTHFVFYMSGAFKGNSKFLPSGVAKELSLAMVCMKKIYLAYRNVDGQMNIYEVKITSKGDNTYEIEGIVGSSALFWKDVCQDEFQTLEQIQARHILPEQKKKDGTTLTPLTPDECFPALPSVLLLKRKK